MCKTSTGMFKLNTIKNQLTLTAQCHITLTPTKKTSDGVYVDGPQRVKWRWRYTRLGYGPDDTGRGKFGTVGAAGNVAAYKR